MSVSLSIRFCLLLFLSLLSSCQKTKDAKGQFEQIGRIERKAKDRRWQMAGPLVQPAPRYPWDDNDSSPHPPITKDFFRCRGSALNPPRETAGGPLYDCGGFHAHSLPIQDDQEMIAPILIDLLNYLQQQTGRKVVITTGHRCLKHHLYSKLETESRSSKHMIGAEVAFYIAGMERETDKVQQLIIDYYREDADEYRLFERYTKPDTGTSTLPWYNKEIYFKLYLEDEGRDFDNRHPYPYFRIQVRYDRKSGKRVLFDWKEAESNLQIY